jgi:hypothetical protein
MLAVSLGCGREPTASMWPRTHTLVGPAARQELIYGVILTTASDGLREALTALFVASADAVARKLASRGISPTVTFSQVFVVRNGDGSMRTDHRAESRSGLTDSSILFGSSPLLGAQEAAQINHCAAMLVERFGSTLPFAVRYGGRSYPLTEPDLGTRPEPPDYQRDPHDWVARMLVQPALLHHLMQLAEVRHASIAASAFVDEVIGVAGAKKLRYLSVVPLSGIDLDPDVTDALVVESVSVRRLSATEQGEWLLGEGVWRVEGFVDPPRVVLELRYAEARDDDLYSPPRERAALFVTSFHLHGYAVAGSVVAEAGERKISSSARRVPQGIFECVVSPSCRRSWEGGLLIHAASGRARGWGCLRTNRSG